MLKIKRRKAEHINICLENEVETGDTLLDNVEFVHQALPDLDLSDIDTSIEFLGKKLSMPLIIAAITGGTEEAEQINKELAKVAEEKGIGFSLGSQRAMIEVPELKNTFYVRDVAKDVLVLGNVGFTQLKTFSVDQIQDALKDVGANAVCVHLNPAQELFQKEGNHDFKGSYQCLEKLCKELKYPVIVKEVGNGVSRETALKLKKAGVTAIDVSGSGGTSWVVVDAIRSGGEYLDFKTWGIPTACSILESKVGLPVIATGGIRNGLDISKSIVLGADLCGISLPFLRILKKDGVGGVERYIDKLQNDLKIIMLLTGSRNIEELKKAKYVLTGKLKDWAEYRKL